MPHGKTKKLAIIFPHRILGLVCSSAGPPPLPMILPQLVRQPPSRMWSTLSPTTIEGGSFSPSHLLPLPPPPPPPPPHPHPHPYPYQLHLHPPPHRPAPPDAQPTA